MICWLYSQNCSHINHKFWIFTTKLMRKRPNFIWEHALKNFLTFIRCLEYKSNNRSQLESSKYLKWGEDVISLTAEVSMLFCLCIYIALTFYYGDKYANNFTRKTFLLTPERKAAAQQAFASIRSINKLLHVSSLFTKMKHCCNCTLQRSPKLHTE